MNAKILVALALSGMALQAVAADPKPNVQKLPSGVEVTHITVGKGAKPTASNTVKVHYEGKLANGKVFDSSYKDGQPISFPLDRVIKCWTEGVQQIKVGGKSRLVCPANLAYGDRGSPPAIKPGATLVFEVELLEIVAAK